MSTTDEIRVPGWDAVEAAGRVAPADPSVLEAAQRHWLRTANATTDPAPTPRRWRGRVVTALAVAAAAVGAVFVVPFGPGGTGAASAEASEVLVRAAAAVDLSVAPSGSYVRVESDTVSRGADQDDTDPEEFDTFIIRERRTAYVPLDPAQPEFWVGSSGIEEVVESDLTLEEARAANPSTEEDADRIVTIGERMPPSLTVRPLEFLQTLPRDPASLREWVYATAADEGNSRDGQAVVVIADVLRTGLVSADLRVALYEVLRTVPGVEVTAADTTFIGRTGVALGRLETVDGERQEILVDPATGEFLGERFVAEDGTVTGGTVSSRLVDEVPAEVRDNAGLIICVPYEGGGIVCNP